MLDGWSNDLVDPLHIIDLKQVEEKNRPASRDLKLNGCGVGRGHAKW